MPILSNTTETIKNSIRYASTSTDPTKLLNYTSNRKFHKHLCRAYIQFLEIKSVAPPVVAQELPLAFCLPLHCAGSDNELNAS